MAGRRCVRCGESKAPRFFRIPSLGERESKHVYSNLCQSCHPRGAYRPKGKQSAAVLREFAKVGLAPVEQVERIIKARLSTRGAGPQARAAQRWLAPVYHFRRDRKAQKERRRVIEDRALLALLLRYDTLMAHLIEHTQGIARTATTFPPTLPYPDAYEHLLTSAPLLRKEILALQIDFDIYCTTHQPPMWRTYPILLRSTLRPTTHAPD